MTDQDRLKLDGIVAKMDSGGASTEEIQAIVNDFKQKYGGQTAPSTGDTRSGIEQAFQPVTSALQGASEFGSGLLKGAAKTVAGIPWVGKQIVPDVVANPKLAEPKTTAESIGSGIAEAAPYLIPVGGEWALLGKAGNVLFKGGLEAAKNYALATFQGGDPKTAAALGAAGPAADQLLAPLGRYLTGSAKRLYGQVLGQTSREGKQLADKVIPELLDRGVMAGTRQSLMDKAGGMAEKAGTALEDAYANLPQDAQLKFTPVLQRLEDAKNNLKVEGTGVVVRDDLYKALDKVQNKVLEIAGGTATEAPISPSVSVGTARSARQQFDSSVNSKTKLFGLTGDEAVKVAADKEAGNAIRSEFAKEYPDIAVINKEFSLWQTVKDLVGAKIDATAGRGAPIGQMLATHAGATVGAATGGGAVGAVLGGAAANSISKLVTSPAWRTVDAVTRSRLADLLVAGRQHEAGVLAAQLAASYAGQP